MGLGESRVGMGPARGPSVGGSFGKVGLMVSVLRSSERWEREVVFTGAERASGEECPDERRKNAVASGGQTH